MKNFNKTITTNELATIYHGMNATIVADFISAAFPADATWSQPELYINLQQIGWSRANIGNKTVSLCYREDGIFLDIVGEVVNPDTIYFRTMEIDGKTCHYLNIDGSCDSNIIEQSMLDDIVKATRKTIWSTWYANESGRLIPADKFIVQHRKKDNKLHFFDTNGGWLRTSTEVVSTEKHANGYVRYVTKSGRVYNLTTV